MKTIVAKYPSNSLAPYEGTFARFGGLVECPAGTYICGVNARMEGNQGSGDDTALNGLKFKSVRPLAKLPKKSRLIETPVFVKLCEVDSLVRSIRSMF